MAGIERITFFGDRSQFPEDQSTKEHSLENPFGNLDFETLTKHVGFYQR
jgi:hypothetical protein